MPLHQSMSDQNKTRLYITLSPLVFCVSALRSKLGGSFRFHQLVACPNMAREAWQNMTSGHGEMPTLLEAATGVIRPHKYVGPAFQHVFVFCFLTWEPMRSRSLLQPQVDSGRLKKLLNLCRGLTSQTQREPLD